MNENIFKERLFVALKNEKVITLATSTNNQPTIRIVSHIFMDGKIYFQTDSESIKFQQILENDKVALSLSSFQIEGTAKIVNHPTESNNKKFLNTFKNEHNGSYNRYSYLPNEVVIEVTINKVKAWHYEDYKPKSFDKSLKRPVIYKLDFDNHEFSEEAYNMNHNMRLFPEAFNEVCNGKKKREYRLFDDKRRIIRVGDTITFHSIDDFENCTTQVEEIKSYNSFKEMYEEYWEEDFKDRYKDMDELMEDNLKYWSQEEEEKYGCVVFKIKKLFNSRK